MIDGLTLISWDYGQWAPTLKYDNSKATSEEAAHYSVEATPHKASVIVEYSLCWSIGLVSTRVFEGMAGLIRNGGITSVPQPDQ